VVTGVSTYGPFMNTRGLGNCGHRDLNLELVVSLIRWRVAPLSTGDGSSGRRSRKPAVEPTPATSTAPPSLVCQRAPSNSSPRTTPRGSRKAKAVAAEAKLGLMADAAMVQAGVLDVGLEPCRRRGGLGLQDRACGLRSR
jgi:hypothetical protein